MLLHDSIEAVYWYPRNDLGLARSEVVEVRDMPFQRAIRATTHKQQRQPWDVVVGANLSASIEKGDVCLLSYWVRGTSLLDKSVDAKVHSYLEFTRSPHEKLVTMAVAADKEWRRIYIPFRAKTTMPEKSVRVVFHLGFAPQTLEIGGISLLNFDNKVALADLPLTRLTYKGREPDAPWRKEALKRINRIRKTELAVGVVDSSGKPVSGAAVQINMLRHAFGFGSSVPARFLGVTEDAETIGRYFDRNVTVKDIRTYRKMFETLFNKATLENDLKHIPWRDSMYRKDSKELTDRALDWLNKRDIAVRGHWLACAVLEELPTEVRYMTRPQLTNYLLAHIRQKVPIVGNRVKEWDSVNHIVGYGETLETLLSSPDIYVDIMKESRKLAPEIPLWVNEGSILADGRCRDPYEKVIGYLIDQGAAPDGIGFMGHFDRLSLTPPDELLKVFDRFRKLISRLQVTELDVDVGDDDQLQADYLSDAMTVAFSHEHCEGIVLWGFWETSHWKPNAALFRKDWSPKPAGEIWKDLVFRQWWTDVQGNTDKDGNPSVIRGVIVKKLIISGHTYRNAALN